MTVKTPFSKCWSGYPKSTLALYIQNIYIIYFPFSFSINNAAFVYINAYSILIVIVKWKNDGEIKFSVAYS